MLRATIVERSQNVYTLDDNGKPIEIELTEAGRVALAEHTTLDPRKLRDGLKALDDFEQDALVKSIRKVTEAID